MPTAWFIAKHTITINYPAFPYAYRQSPIDEVSLKANGGNWRKIEISDRLIYKISASNAVLNAVANLANVKRIPDVAFNTTLSELTQNQRQGIRDELTDQGYTQADLDAAGVGNLANVTLRQVLRFMAKKHALPRFNINTLLVEPSDEVLDESAQVDVVEAGVT